MAKSFFVVVVPSLMVISAAASVTWSLRQVFLQLPTPVSNRQKCWLLLIL